MIILKVEDYCQSCRDFTADVTSPARIYTLDGVAATLGDTIVQCEYRKRCAGIKRYLESQEKESKDD